MAQQGAKLTVIRPVNGETLPAIRCRSSLTNPPVFLSSTAPRCLAAFELAGPPAILWSRYWLVNGIFGAVTDT